MKAPGSRTQQSLGIDIAESCTTCPPSLAWYRFMHSPEIWKLPRRSDNRCGLVCPGGHQQPRELLMLFLTPPGRFLSLGPGQRRKEAGLLPVLNHAPSFLLNSRRCIQIRARSCLVFTCVLITQEIVFVQWHFSGMVGIIKGTHPEVGAQSDNNFCVH